MAVELQVLAAAVLLAGVQLALFAVPANRLLGTGYTAGPRDERRELGGVPGRLQRAFQNLIENLVLHTAATVAVVLGEAGSSVTAAAAVVWLAARIAYVPAYASGIPYLRSGVWAVGWLATMSLAAAAVL